MSERVLTVPTKLLHEVGYFQGHARDVDRYLSAFFAPGNSGYAVRETAENDPSQKQLIPYVVLACGSAAFSYVRGSRSGEKRLVALRSIGIGGHINPLDDGNLFRDPADVYREAARREVEEEVRVESPYRESIVALINDDSNDVGRVHLGIVHLWRLEAPLVTKREQQITQSGFVELGELARLEPQLETWSRIALAVLGEVLSETI